MRVRKLEDLTPHEALYEKMAFCGQFLPVLDGVKVVYYKRYRQADIEAPEGYKCPYVDSNGESELLRGVAAKIMLMRDIINKIGVGGQLTLNLERV